MDPVCCMYIYGVPAIPNKKKKKKKKTKNKKKMRYISAIPLKKSAGIVIPKTYSLCFLFMKVCFHLFFLCNDFISNISALNSF